jgi:hypothetical protein
MRRDVSRRIERLEWRAGITEDPLPNLFFTSRTNKRVRTLFAPSQTDANGNENRTKRRKFSKPASWVILRRPVTGRRSSLF